MKIAAIIHNSFQLEIMKIDIYKTENKYDIIYADPPWQQSKRGKKSVRPKSKCNAVTLYQLVYIGDDNSITTEIENSEERAKARLAVLKGGKQ